MEMIASQSVLSITGLKAGAFRTRQVKVIVDTNILIDHFDGIKEATEELAMYEDIAISTITWSEVARTAPPLARHAMSHIPR